MVSVIFMKKDVKDGGNEIIHYVGQINGRCRQGKRRRFLTEGPKIMLYEISLLNLRKNLNGERKMR